MDSLTEVEKQLLAYLLRQAAHDCRRKLAATSDSESADRLRLVHSIARNANIDSIELESL